jgi:pimeloyl-ACP methyl ester carboxylesterase
MQMANDPVEFRVFHVPSPQAPDAPTYLLLHGVGLSHRSFSRLAGWLVETGHVIALDLPGFGATRHPRHELAIEGYATGVSKLMDAEGLGPVVVVGHSMGAQVAAELAVQRPDLVEAIVVIGPVPDKPSRLQLGLRLVRNSALEPPLTSLMVIGEYLRCGIRWFVKEVDAMVGYELAPAVRAAKAPVLIIRGRDDPIAGPGWCGYLARVASVGTLVTIEDARHVVPHSQPEAVADAIADFALRIRIPRA